MTILPGVYDLNVHLDEHHALDTGEERYVVDIYRIGFENGMRVTQTHEAVVAGIVLPQAVVDAIPDADETWLDSDGEGVPHLLREIVEKATRQED